MDQSTPPTGPSTHGPGASPPRNRPVQLLINAIVLLIAGYAICFVIMNVYRWFSPPRRERPVARLLTVASTAPAQASRELILAVVRREVGRATGLDEKLAEKLQVDSLNEYAGCANCFEAVANGTPNDPQGRRGAQAWRVVLRVDGPDAIKPVFVSVGQKVVRDELGHGGK